MKANYDPDEDILYIVVKEGSIFDSREIDEDIQNMTKKEMLRGWRS